jgi:branched-chain amino acid transport system substrate-binding protein
MRKSLNAVVAVIVTTMLVGLPAGDRVQAQPKTIRIGLPFDYTGPHSVAGSLANWRGARLAIAPVADRGGILGRYAVDADREWKPDVALNDAERLLDVENVAVLARILSSAHAVLLAEKVDRQKRLLWITTGISDAVFRRPDLHYVFRPGASRDMFGALSVRYLAAHPAAKVGKAPADLRVAAG